MCPQGGMAGAGRVAGKLPPQLSASCRQLCRVFFLFSIFFFFKKNIFSFLFFFLICSFAYLLVKILQDGPSKDSHMNVCGGASPPLAALLSLPHAPAPTSLGLNLCEATWRPPSRACLLCGACTRSSRQTPREQAEFFLLMSELHYRFILGVERLHTGRKDDVASSLQPCIAPGTTDVQAPLEAQGRGFTHGHGKGHRLTPFIITFGSTLMLLTFSALLCY